MKTFWAWLRWSFIVILGSCLFSLGFVWFLDLNEFNGGGITGVAQIVAHLFSEKGIPGLAGLTSKLSFLQNVSFWTIAFNVPLFVIGGLKIGKKFFFGSLLGLVSVSFALEVFAKIPEKFKEQLMSIDPLLACLYGGVLVGLGLGIVFMAGASTGGSDIICRLLKRKWRNVPIGTITMGFDIVVIFLTGLAFGDIRNALYTGVTVFLCGKVLDIVVYSFDYSKVAIIISEKHEEIADWIIHKMVRGVTYLEGQGAYSQKSKKVILTVVKKHQLAELKEQVVAIDPDAFVILQEAHQVLGDGFARYTKDSL